MPEVTPSAEMRRLPDPYRNPWHRWRRRLWILTHELEGPYCLMERLDRWMGRRADRWKERHGKR